MHELTKSEQTVKNQPKKYFKLFAYAEFLPMMKMEMKHFHGGRRVKSLRAVVYFDDFNRGELK